MSRGSHVRGYSQQDNAYDRANATAGAHRRQKTQMATQQNNFLAPMQEEQSNQDIRTFNSSVSRLYPGGGGESNAGLSQYSPSKRGKTALEMDHSFNREMKDTITNLKRMPGFKNKVWDRVTSLH